MTAVAVIGAEGFVGSAFVRLLAGRPDIELSAVTRSSYASSARRDIPFDVVIDCGGNSRKYVAERSPLEDFEATVTHRLRVLLDFQADLHVHVSSVDVYADLTSPATTGEDVPIDVARTSRYGFHKLLAEQLVRHYCDRWLIVRLAGMVGPGLRKNPVFDIVQGHPLRIHPNSRYQFMHTDDVAEVVWRLATSGQDRIVFNVAGRGTISPRQIADLAGRPLDLSLPVPESPRIVEVDTSRVEVITPLPETMATIAAFCRAGARLA